MKFLVPCKVSRPEESKGDEQIFRVDTSRKVIKSSQVAVWKSADEVIRLAQERSEQILLDSKAAFEEEKKRGYRDGLDTAKEEQAEHMIEQVARAVDYFETVEKRVVDLVLAAVKKIVYDYRDEERTVAVVKNALSTVRNQKQVVIRVHPSALDNMRDQVNELLAEFPGINYIDVTSDSRLERDGCMLETDIGLVEVNITHQLKAIREAFERVLGKQHGL
ncbi:HrpE/YscL family type III secretion apparatus protein [Candidatus Ichthyocystis hellenicum]|uniref:HrpE/YscL family type III secretion apparatus protein n=1 Tax=Candidatus Ichthyocystis hellenicum TaxID=1561003 RepID=UPI000B849417|nr:HrpE/YscL family type III secretion apparatus protein [Candidatus Ichthyocystis hellenicum]